MNAERKFIGGLVAAIFMAASGYYLAEKGFSAKPIGENWDCSYRVGSSGIYKHCEIQTPSQ